MLDIVHIECVVYMIVRRYTVFVGCGTVFPSPGVPAGTVVITDRALNAALKDEHDVVRVSMGLDTFE